jgi:hypothetical protein
LWQKKKINEAKLLKLALVRMKNNSTTLAWLFGLNFGVPRFARLIAPVGTLDDITPPGNYANLIAVGVVR